MDWYFPMLFSHLLYNDRKTPFKGKILMPLPLYYLKRIMKNKSECSVLITFAPYEFFSNGISLYYFVLLLIIHTVFT